MSIIALSILLILLISMTLYLKLHNRTDVSAVESTDGSTYYLANEDHQHKALQQLEEVRRRIDKFKEYFEQNPGKYPEYQPYIDQLLERSKNVKLNETPPDGNLTSFTINKGEEISLCLRSKRDGHIHGINLIMYVTLHELSHVACPEKQHTPLFKKIFVFFLEIGKQIGIYVPIQFDKHPLEYCGMTITENLLNH